MSADSLGQAALYAVVGVIGSGLAYLGVRNQTRTAREGSRDTSAQVATSDAMDTLRELIDPLRAELKEVRTEVAAARSEAQAATTRVGKLERELQQWKAVARTLAHWGVALRDQVIQLGGKVVAEPEELITLRLLDDDALLRQRDEPEQP